MIDRTQEGDERRTREKSGPDIQTGAEGAMGATAEPSTTKRKQPSALGGDVATRSKAQPGKPRESSRAD